MAEPVDSQSIPEKEGKPAVWGGVTDPGKHQENNFRYLVHGFNFHQRLNATLLGIEFQERGMATAQDVSNQATDLFLYPERLAQRVSVSISLIDQDHRGTWGSLGLIVEAPNSNVVLTSTSDMGAGNVSREMLLAQARNHGIIPGDQLLANSGGGSYNEVVALGTSEQGEPLRLVGFFVKTVEGEYVDAENAYQLEAHAKRLSIPLVKIEQPNRFSEESVEVSQQYQKVYVNYGGRRYILPFGDFKESDFDILNSELESRFMSPQELEKALLYIQSLIDSGKNPELPQNIISTLREKYDQADKARRAPRFNRDGDTINGFRMTMGYGDEEYEVRVREHGAYRFSMPLERAELRRMMAQGNRYIHSENSAGIVLSAEEVDQLLEENLKLLPSETTKQIQDYYDSARAAIQQRFEQEQKNRSDFSHTSHLSPKYNLGRIFPAEDSRKPYKIFPQPDLSKLSEFIKRRKPEEDQ